MIKKHLFIINSFLFINLIFNTISYAGINNTLTYVSPLPNSELNQPATNIILKFNTQFEPVSLNTNNISVSGSVSGYHKGVVFPSDGKRLYIFKPNEKFTNGEIVNVSINNLRSANNAVIPEYSYNFKIAKHQITFSDIEFCNLESNSNNYQSKQTCYGFPYKNGISNDTIPGNFPMLTTLRDNNSTSGKNF